MDDIPFNLANLLKHLDKSPDNLPLSIEIDGHEWITQTGDLKNILRGAMFENPALREALNEAHGEIEALQEQIEGLCSREDGGVVQVYHSLLAQIEKLPSDAPVKIKAKDYSFHWDVMAKDIKNLLMAFLFVVPSLRNERNSALEKIETLQEQIAGDGEPENEMDTVLKRALHHLERFADHYYSSAVDEVVIELRQLITEAKYEVKGETLCPEYPKWEYRSIPFNKRMKYVAKFDQLGAEGWELFQIDYSKNIAFLKRPI